MPPRSSASSATQAVFYSTKYEAPQQEPCAIVSPHHPLVDGGACPRCAAGISGVLEPVGTSAPSASRNRTHLVVRSRGFLGRQLPSRARCTVLFQQEATSLGKPAVPLPPLTSPSTSLLKKTCALHPSSGVEAGGRKYIACQAGVHDGIQVAHWFLENDEHRLRCRTYLKRRQRCLVIVPSSSFSASQRRCLPRAIMKPPAIV